MLFSALWLGSLYGQSSDEEGLHSPNELNFFKYAAQALVTGQYHKAKPYSVEAMVLHAQCRWMQKTDRGTDGWMIISISTRLAMRMGYHRDPHHLANISPFEGEMRRRTFSIVEIFDLLLSFRAGLPAIIHEEECDTQPPRNLFDEDFDEDCKILPPSRPSTDPTPMLYFVYKSGFAKLMKRVIRHALSLKPPLYKETMKLDDDLHKMHDNVPPSLQMRPLSTLFTDQTHVVINKLYIDMVYLKSLCVLHRFSLSHERSNPALAYSRKTCTDAALQLLKHQAEVYALCQPEGRFFNDKFMLSTLVMHDFLFAAMMICLDLYESYQISPATSQEELVAQTTEYDALRLTHEIWTWRKAFSKDAHRASNVVAVMLSKVPRPVPLGIPRFKNHGGPGVFTMATSSGSTSWETTLFDNVKGPQSFWLGNCPTLDVNRADDTPPPPLPVDLADIDWGLFDQYLLDRGGADDVSLD